MYGNQFDRNPSNTPSLLKNLSEFEWILELRTWKTFHHAHISILSQSMTNINCFRAACMLSTVRQQLNKSAGLFNWKKKTASIPVNLRSSSPQTCWMMEHQKPSQSLPDCRQPSLRPSTWVASSPRPPGSPPPTAPLHRGASAVVTALLPAERLCQRRP